LLQARLVICGLGIFVVESGEFAFGTHSYLVNLNSELVTTVVRGKSKAEKKAIPLHAGAHFIIVLKSEP
jgi:hypothetical protein